MLRPCGAAAHSFCYSAAIHYTFRFHTKRPELSPLCGAALFFVVVIVVLVLLSLVAVVPPAAPPFAPRLVFTVPLSDMFTGICLSRSSLSRFLLPCCVPGAAPAAVVILFDVDSRELKFIARSVSKRRLKMGKCVRVSVAVAAYARKQTKCTEHNDMMITI